jgi:hypothetical protein
LALCYAARPSSPRAEEVQWESTGDEVRLPAL